MKRVLLVACLMLPFSAGAHLGGIPTTANFTEPVGVGHVVDGAITFRWMDYDAAADTEDTRIDFFYTTTMPPTFRPGAIPKTLSGIAIEKGVVEKDPTNALDWDTADVPPGSYFLYSIAHDPPFQMVAFSRGVITVAREGDPVHPAIVIEEPDGIRDVAEGGRFEIRWSAFDPDESGKVTIEVGTSLDAGLSVVAEDLDPEDGSYVWNTEGLTVGDWMVKATLRDARGMEHAAYGAFFVRVLPSGGGQGGNGGSGGDDEGKGGADGGAGGTDSTKQKKKRDGGGCSASAGASGLLPLAVLLPLLRRRSGRA